jgi:adenylate cyclase
MAIFQQIKINASEDRLESLIGLRMEIGANKTEIDERIKDLFEETWSIMFTDLSGFSRNVAEFGIIHFLQIIYESHRLLIPCINEQDGILLKKEGDSLLVIFKRPEKAILSAIAMQQVLKEYNQGKQEAEKVLLCVGIGYGKVLKIGDDDVFGEEVNAASKLGEDTAKAWEILVTESAKTEISQNKFSFSEIETVFTAGKKNYKLNY